jgi:hypothetical protein
MMATAMKLFLRSFPRICKPTSITRTTSLTMQPSHDGSSFTSGDTAVLATTILFMGVVHRLEAAQGGALHREDSCVRYTAAGMELR